MKIYHNPSYSEYQGGDCYLFCLMDGIMFLSTPKDTFKVLQKPIIEPELQTNAIKEEDLDTYAASRGFEKVVDVNRNAYSMESPEIIWYNGYDDQDKKKILKVKIDVVIKSIAIKNKYRYPSSGYFPATYQIMTCFRDTL